MQKLKKLGLEEAHCYGGDTCIAATTMTKEAAIVVQGPKSKSLRQLLKNTGLNPRAECFGGDTCIV
jgi:translation initiation factor 1 (eIF-1/SUI1)